LGPGVAEHLGPPADLAGDGPGVGVDQQLVGVVAKSLAGRIATVDAETVVLPRSDPVHVAVPVQVGAFDQLVEDALPAAGIEQHELDRLGVLGEQGEVGALPVPGGPHGDVVARPGRLQDPAAGVPAAVGSGGSPGSPGAGAGCRGAVGSASATAFEAGIRVLILLQPPRPEAPTGCDTDISK